MKRMIAAAVGLSLLLTLTTGCGKKAETAVPTQEPAEPEAAQEMEPAPAVLTRDALTGKEMDYPGQRPVAVMLNSDTRKNSIWGIGSARVVVEAVTTGQQTGLMALYPSTQVMQKVGPVTQADDVFLQLALPLNALPICIGKTVYADNLLNALSYQDLDGEHIGVACFDYDKDRGTVAKNEFCWYTNTNLLQSGLEQCGISAEGATCSIFHFAEGERARAEIPAGGPERNAEQMNIVYGYNDMVCLSYRPESGLYLRLDASGYGTVDANDGETMAQFENVFLLFCEAGVKDDVRTRDYDFSKGGAGIYLYGGAWEPITWAKNDVGGLLTLYGTDGNELTVAQGRSYLGILGGFGDQRAALYANDGTEQAIPDVLR